ncbi:MAG: hypothetical protein HRF43_04255 [Phycisphaerae bacterium]
MQRRTRNRICIWLIVGGLLNFLAYTIAYGALGGDAMNGRVETVRLPEGGSHRIYTVSGHYLRSIGGRDREVPAWVWYYSYLHSISLWPTQAVMMIGMLILARPHIIATMAESTWIRGPTFIATAMTLTLVIYSALTVWFVTHLIRDVTGGA